MAAGVVKKLILKEDVSDNEIQFLKEQTGDIFRILGVISLGAVSTLLPVVVEKALNTKGLSILPRERMSTLTNDEEQEKLVESICKKTGKSKKYVHSLINRYL
jgi:hypothetical protein